MARNPWTETLALAAENGDFSRLQAFIDRVCVAAGCDPGQTARTQIVIEELFTNTLKHGRTSTARATISVTAEAADEKKLVICYEDTAPRHDPFANHDQMENLLLSLTRRPVGGLGVVMIQQLGRNVRYEWSGGKNRVIFSVATELPQPSARKPLE
jgi:anti-sigma regulatory factor (Ser/Thr protein kinase)